MARKTQLSKHPLYNVWKKMLHRCYHPYHHKFKLYGARGIGVCDRWRESFEAFLADMGPRPSPIHTLDRRDNDGHYEPGNVFWATPKEQCRNRRGNIHITINGVTRLMIEWCEFLNINPELVRRKKSAGVGPLAALYFAGCKLKRKPEPAPDWIIEAYGRD